MAPRATLWRHTNAKPANTEAQLTGSRAGGERAGAIARMNPSEAASSNAPAP